MKNAIPYLVMELGEKEDAPNGAIPINLYGSGPGGGTSEPGPQGDPGLQGEPGPQGEPGIQGPAGRDGQDGAPGEQGAAGQSGGEGPQGVQGPRGERGSDGTSVVIDGYVQAEQDLPDLTGNPAGPSYIVMDTGHIHFWNGTAFTDGGNVTGPAGADGVPGVQGPAGAQGLQGIQGQQGPKGDQGTQGVQGVQGERGPIGATGPVAPPPEPNSVGDRRVVTANIQSSSPMSIEVGSWRVSLIHTSQFPLVRLNSLAGTIQTDYGSIGSAGGGEGAGPFVRLRRNEAVTTSSITNVSPATGISHFWFMRTGGTEIWEGSAFCPAQTGMAVLKVERVF